MRTQSEVISQAFFLLLSMLKRKFNTSFLNIGSLEAGTKMVNWYEFKFILPNFTNRSILFEAICNNSI
jgi:hypothetical protein